MQLEGNNSQIRSDRWKKTRYIPQIINGIISISLGITTLQLKRSHKYVFGGYYDPSYPWHNNPSQIISDEPLSFLSKYSPVLSASIVSILSSIYLFSARVNKDIKLWVKLLIVFLNVAWLLFVALIPSSSLAIIEHPIYLPQSTYYGVFGIVNQRKSAYNNKRIDTHVFSKSSKNFTQKE